MFLVLVHNKEYFILKLCVIFRHLQITNTLRPRNPDAGYRNLENGKTLSLAGYRGLSVYVCLFVFLLAPVSGQEIWPDTGIYMCVKASYKMS